MNEVVVGNSTLVNGHFLGSIEDIIQCSNKDQITSIHFEYSSGVLCYEDSDNEEDADKGEEELRDDKIIQLTKLLNDGDWAKGLDRLEALTIEMADSELEIVKALLSNRLTNLRSLSFKQAWHDYDLGFLAYFTNFPEELLSLIRTNMPGLQSLTLDLSECSTLQMSEFKSDLKRDSLNQALIKHIMLCPQLKSLSLIHHSPSKSDITLLR
ncbi:hypothetical protein SAMD00019534_028870 [Acytostelium subglobosum LB1]|uniref:hypothetical protein n=1 Tax=Acytostelium subglobosum LB1 TaxID=1410327 RepID=UPI0006451CC5|nr:hypothetical protein SAMD00019534_028870 [Acytostelium subglobosum LB1]GAM19712.1 hypothetical protein SAMD00019534_028870 [Acytostelium subglobosum LB1]|eukprot:XP_012756474.1 hypothetical protein SAMD00019534_028870 [Acytostelium subglobosum LB1]